MTSIQHEDGYKDKVHLDSENDTFLVENEPLSGIFDIIYGYEKVAYWQKSYKAYWCIRNNKLFLQKITGSLNSEPISLKKFAKDINVESNKLGVFASWYSNDFKILRKIDPIYNEESDPINDVITYLVMTVEKGIVVDVTETQEQKMHLPF